MMVEVPETKLVKLLVIALTEKNTLMKRHCVGQTFVVHCRKAATLQLKNLTYLNYLVLVQMRKNKLSFVFKLYFSLIFNYVQLNYKFLSGI